jgi:hypothetical protein
VGERAPCLAITTTFSRWRLGWPASVADEAAAVAEFCEWAEIVAAKAAVAEHTATVEILICSR